MRGVKGFKGTLAKDQFIGTIKPLECGVVNLDDSTGPGTHFTCYYNSPKNEHVYYFDTYGIVPPEQIKAYLLSSGKKIAWNTTQYQPIASTLCGYYCVFVLKELAKGKTLYDAIRHFDLNNTEKNDQFIKNNQII